MGQRCGCMEWETDAGDREISLCDRHEAEEEHRAETQAERDLEDALAIIADHDWALKVVLATADVHVLDCALKHSAAAEQIAMNHIKGR